MKIKIKFHQTWAFGKASVLGCFLRNPNMEIQQHLETIIYAGYFSIIITYKFKFTNLKTFGDDFA